MIERLSPDHVFGFNEQDIEENRRGKLSERQAGIIRSEGFRTALVICGIIIGIVLLAVVSTQSVQGGEIQCVGGLMFMIVLYVFYHYIIRIEAAVRPRTVQALTGQPTLIVNPNGSIMTISGQIFKLSLSEARAFRPDTAYTLYIVPALRRIVAVESYSGEARHADPLPLVEITMPTDDSGSETLRA